MNLISKLAPNFTAKAVMKDNVIENSFNLKQYLSGHKGILFFYPLDFSFVCPSEIIAFNNRINIFSELHTRVVGVSVDSQYSHYAWRNTPVEQGGIGEIQFPIVSDIKKTIASDYGVLHEEGIALRGSFLIDEDFRIRHYVINDFPLGRNIDEIIRMIEAWDYYRKYGDVCPAGWQKGDLGMKPTEKGVSSYLSEYHKKL